MHPSSPRKRLIVIPARAPANFVIPAKAGIHVATVKVKMGPRFRGDDDWESIIIHAATLPPR